METAKVGEGIQTIDITAIHSAFILGYVL